MANPTNIAETPTPAPTAIPVPDGNTAENAASLQNAAINVWDTYINALGTANGYIELLTLGISIVSGVAAALLLRWIIRIRFKEIANSSSWSWVLKPTKLFVPLFVIVALSIARPIVLHYVPSPVFIYPATQIATAWLLVYTVHLLVHSNLMAWFLSIIIASLIGLQSFGLLQPITQLLRSISFNVGHANISILSVIQGIVLCVILFWLAHASSVRFEHQMRASKLSYNVRELLIKFFKIVIFFVALLVTLAAIGVDLTAFAVFGGALGVGIGLGLQKITANFVSGITLLLERSIRQGDLIQVEGVQGYVRALNIRYTLVETFNGQEVSIPNETLTSKNIINWTMSNARARIEIPVGVAYGSDYKLVQKLMLQAAQEHKRSMKEPHAICIIREFNATGVLFSLQFWVDNVTDGLQIPQSEVMFRIAELFEAHHVQISFPKPDVRFVSAPDMPNAAEKPVPNLK